jgi:predicted DCC family thiol-disulfide oxidoreductase YuxK
MGAPVTVGNKSIILFDGICNLCNASVLFIIKRDPRVHFYFQSIQDADKAKLPADLSEKALNLESILLIENNKLYKRSTAALRIARRLNALWPLLYVFVIVPVFIRDPLYNFIARNRYRWFGKKDFCMIPTPELKSRFI